MRYIFLSIFLLSGLAPAVCGARTPELPQWELSADSLAHIQEPEGMRIVAEGDVVLSRPGGPEEALVIKADRMSYYPEQKVVEASGRVSVESSDEQARADSVVLHLATETGTLSGATIFLPDSGLYIKGDSIEKTGELTYELRGAWLSACHPDDDCPPAWSITSGRARVTLEGMAHLYHPAFRVREWPVLYSPYLLLPAKTMRHSGFLFPEWSHSSRDGFGVNLPYFINLSPSADLTLYPYYLERRGLLAGGEFNYAAGPDSKGKLVGSYLKDRHVDSESDDYRDDGQLRTLTERYWARGKADHDFGDNLIGRMDLDMTSDQDFIREFRSGSIGHGALDQEFLRKFGRGLQDRSLPVRQSLLQLSKGWEKLVLTGELRQQQETRHQPPPVTPLQSLPRLNLAGRSPLAGRSSSLVWDSEYVNYWRSQGIGAQRLDLHPQVVVPMPRAGGWLEGRITTGVRHTMYQVTEQGDEEVSRWEYDHYQERSAFDLEANMATTLVRDFNLAGFVSNGDADSADPGRKSWLEHMVRPNLIYTYLNRTVEEELPRLDAVDRLQRKYWLTYELNNYFELAGIREGNYHSRSLAYFRIAQTYNLREGWRKDERGYEPDREWSDLRLEMQLDPLTNFSLRYQANFSAYDLGTTRRELRGRYRSAGGGSFSVGYRFLKYDRMAEPYFYTAVGEKMHDLIGNFDLPVTSTVSLYGMINKALSEDHINESSIGLRYRPHCWAVELEYYSDDDERKVMVIFTLDAIGQVLSGQKGGV